MPGRLKSRCFQRMNWDHDYSCMAICSNNGTSISYVYLGILSRGKVVRKMSSNEVGTDGWKIRAFIGRLSFTHNPGCGCAIVWAPDYSTDPEKKPFVLKFFYQLCSAMPRHRRIA